jgi:hypothetical protein
MPWKDSSFWNDNSEVAQIQFSQGYPASSILLSFSYCITDSSAFCMTCTKIIPETSVNDNGNIERKDTIRNKKIICDIRDSLSAVNALSLKCIRGFQITSENNEQYAVFFKKGRRANCFRFSDPDGKLGNTNYGYIERLFENPQLFKIPKRDIIKKGPLDSYESGIQHVR